MNRNIFSRNFILCSAGQFSSSFVFFILIPTIPIYLSKLGATDAEIGILVGALSVSSLVLRPFVGRALLKISERDFMMAGSVIYTLASLAYIVASPFFPLLIVRIFHGVGMAFFATASFTLIARITPDSHRGQSIGFFYLAINLAFALAPSVGMFLIQLFDFTVLFVVCAGLSFCALCFTYRLERVQSESSEDSSTGSRLFLSRGALPPSLLALMASFIWGAVTAFFPLFAVSQGVSNPGIFFGVVAIMLILGRSLGGKILDLYEREKVLLPCMATQITAMAILAFSTTLFMFVLAAVIWGGGNAFLYPSLVASSIERSGSARGPAIATYSALSDLGSGLGAVIMGMVLQVSNYRTMFLGLVLVGFVCLGYFHFLFKKRSVNRYANL